MRITSYSVHIGRVMASAAGTWPDPDAIPPAKHRPLYSVKQCRRFTCNRDGSRCTCAHPLHDGAFHRFPHRIDLSNGMKKWICMCGQSKVYPLCDGWGHEAYNEKYGTDIQPVVVSRDIVGKDSAMICGCGHSRLRHEANLPFCDGTHSKLATCVDLEDIAAAALPAIPSSSSSVAATSATTAISSSSTNISSATAARETKTITATIVSSPAVAPSSVAVPAIAMTATQATRAPTSCKSKSVACSCQPITSSTASRGPIRVELPTSGTAAIQLCQCGHSATFPYCDNSHQAYNAAHRTTFAPFKVDATTFATTFGAGRNVVYICGCGHSRKRLAADAGPFCDGSHNLVVDLEQLPLS